MMQPVVLDANFGAVKVLDAYSALIWAERYNKSSDFEFHAPANLELIDAMQIGRYLYLEETNKLMIIEKIEITTNVSEGNELTVSGRSLESILDRRIVWNQTTLDGYLEGQIQKLLNESIISPSDPARRIDNFVFEASGDPAIGAMTIRSQYTGDNVYSVIQEICEDRGIGFEIYFNSNDQFVFRLRNGADRSYDQSDNEAVVFSPAFDNLIDSDYTYSNASYKTVALVAGEEQGDERKRTTIQPDPVTGFNRRELYIDARDIRQEEGVSDADYNLLLQQRANEKMTAYLGTQTFDASMETNLAAKYGEDFFLGDIVQIQNEYGIGGKCRVTEIIRSMKSSGYFEYPTFKML